jgi:sigma-B regulation protein RsbU (phosphoserine phosphatase)
MPDGSGQTFVTVTALTELLLAVGGAYLYFRLQNLRRRCDALVQEKEVIFGFMHDVGEVFAEGEDVDPDSLLKRVLFYALRTSRGAAGAVYLYDQSAEHLRVHALSGIFPPLWGDAGSGLDHAVSKSKHVEHLVRTRALRRGEGLIGQVADLNAPLLLPDAESDPRVPRHRTDFLRIRSLLLVPMHFQQQVLGVLAVANRVDGRPFTESDLSLLQALADQASASVHYAGLRESLAEKKRIDHDLSVARQIQLSLLPRELPHVKGIEASAYNEPAREIGGDYYDFVRIDDRHMGIAIADVSGKSVGGAMMMSICRSVLRAQASSCLSPAEVLKAVNRVIAPDMAPDMFISMLYMVVDMERHEVVIARAGHERPAIIRADGRSELIDSPGIVIGMTDRETFDQLLGEARTPLGVGDVVVGYTDGITEAMNEAGEEWGLDEFLKAARVGAPDGAHSVLNNVRQRLQRFVGNYAQYDDMTLLALRRTA